MKNKNLALVAVLFTISVIMAFANGPTPQVVIDTDQIIDGAVTILKTDGVAANDLSNVTPATGRAALGLGTISTVDSPVPIANGGTGATSAATGLAALGGAALNGNIAVPFSASTINGVAPLTAAEKTQALVGSSTVDFNAKFVDTTMPYNAGYTWFKCITRGFGNMPAGTIADNASISIPITGNFPSVGYMIITCTSSGRGAMFFFSGTTVAIIAQETTEYTVTKGTDNKTNVYIENGKLYIENMLGGIKGYACTLVGLQPQ